MIRSDPRRLLVGLALVSVLGGCALAGGGRGPRPQSYRFGVDGAVAIQAQAEAPSRTVGLNALEFQPAAAGDRLLAVQEPATFYIAGARWVSRAEDLFTGAAERAFAGQGLRLARRGQPFSADAGMVMAVPVFEARYLAGPEAAPTVFVEVRATMLGRTNDILAERTFAVSQPAATNSVAQIVAAYDVASGQALEQLATWAAATAPRPPAS